MTDLILRNDFTVALVDHMGNDDSIIKAMLVSTKGAESLDAEATPGRINFLMANRHGTPFEHNAMTFYVEAPIAVFREWHRHRIGVSYNEMSARYTQLPPMFYIPPPDRPLVQVGKPGHYTFVPGTDGQMIETGKWLTKAYWTAYETYEHLLAQGVAKEVARMCLPVGIYSAMYFTCNARSMMSFLSLRVKEEGSTFPSYPQWEIEQCARAMENGMTDAFAKLFPMTYESFVRNGRVSP